MFKGKVVEMLKDMVKDGTLSVKVVPTETGIEKTEVYIYIDGEEFRVTK